MIPMTCGHMKQARKHEYFKFKAHGEIEQQCAHSIISLSAPSAEVPLVPHPPQAVAIEEAAVNNNDSTLEYWIEADEFPEVAANTVVVVNAQTQYSRPSSRLGSAAASPNPLIGIWIAGVLEAVITEAQAVYQAPRRPPPPSQTPPPPPLYADSAL